jgi:hypothetical protein
MIKLQNKKIFSKRVLVVVLVFIGIALFIINYLFYQTGKKSKAAAGTVSLSFVPTSAVTQTNQDFSVTIKVQPSAVITIRGYEFRINFNKDNVAVKEINYHLGAASVGLGDDTSTKDAVNNRGYIKIQGESREAVGLLLQSGFSVNVVTVTFTSKSNAASNIEIPSNSVKFYKIEQDYGLSEIPASGNVTFTVNGSGGTTPTTIQPTTIQPTTIQPTTIQPTTIQPTTIQPTTTRTPTPTGTSTNAVNLNLKLKFQGVLKKPKNSSPIIVKVKLGNSRTQLQTDYQKVIFTVDDEGVWRGRVAFSNVSSGSQYTLYVKGPKHLQKKICDQKPTESVLGPGTYNCQEGKITLQAGENDLDLTGILLLAGDLPVNGTQDGVINALDTVYVRNSLGKSDATTLSICDVNLDNSCDTQDWSVILQALSIKGDEL